MKIVTEQERRQKRARLEEVNAECARLRAKNERLRIALIDTRSEISRIWGHVNTWCLDAALRRIAIALTVIDNVLSRDSE